MTEIDLLMTVAHQANQIRVLQGALAQSQASLDDGAARLKELRDRIDELAAKRVPEAPAP